METLCQHLRAELRMVVKTTGVRGHPAEIWGHKLSEGYEEKIDFLATEMPLSTDSVILLLLQGVTELKFKSMMSERSILGWDGCSVGFKCLAHVSGKHQLLPKALARPLEQEMGEKKYRRLGDGLCALSLGAD